MQVSAKLLKKLNTMAEEIDCYGVGPQKKYLTKLCALGKNKDGVITDIRVLKRVGGCVFMPRVNSGNIAKAYNAFIKKGGSFAGFALVYCSAVARTTRVPKEQLWESHFEDLLYRFAEVPIMLVTNKETPVFTIYDPATYDNLGDLPRIPVEEV